MIKEIMDTEKQEAEGLPEERPAIRFTALLPVFIVLVSGLLISLLVYLQLRAREREYIQIDFESTARFHINAFQSEIQAHLADFNAVAAALGTADLKDRNWFRAFTESLKKDRGRLSPVCWCPRISGSGTDPFDTVYTHELESTTPWRHDGQREDAWPVLNATTNALEVIEKGFDLASIPELSRAIRNSRRLEEVFLISNITLPGAEAHPSRVFAVVPVFRKNMADNTEKVFSGVVLGILDVNQILSEALTPIKERGVDIWILDTYLRGANHLLAFWLDPTSDMKREPVDVGRFLFEEGIRYFPRIDFGTRRWILLCRPTAEFLAAAWTWRPLIGAGGVVYLMVILMLYLIRNIYQRREIELLVLRRTRQLREANSRLRNEIQERKRFEQERDELLHLQEEWNEALQTSNTRLEQSNADLQDFAFVVSHDLKEPLRKIQVFCNRLRNLKLAAASMQQNEYLDLIDDSAFRMQDLIKDILEFSRVSTHGNRFHEVDLNTVIDQVSVDLSVQIEESRAEIVTENLPEIAGDPAQLRQLFQNLLSNSIKYRKTGVAPEIGIEGTILEAPRVSDNGSPGSEGLCRITVSDNGIGFDDSDAPRIFSLFQRLQRGGAYEGTGVGLAVCRKIVERHGGAISAHSSLNNGAVFTILLPMRQEKGHET